MAVLPYDRSPSRLPVWLGAGGITVLVVLGVVVMGLPLQCNLGLSWDNTCPAGTAGASTIRPVLTPTEPTKTVPPRSPAAIQPAANQASAGTAQNLVAATFGRLGPAATQPQVVAPAAALSAPVAPSVAAGPSQSAASQLATRVVKTLAVGPDGSVGNVAPAGSATQPVPLAALPARAASSAPPATSVAQAQSTVTQAAAPASPATAADPPTPLPAVEAAPTTPRVAAPAPRAAVQAVASTGSVRIVGGSGVTVRSLPGHNGGRLFALSPGEHVTVSATQRGWLRITTSKGQSGWAYSSFFH